MAHYLLTGAAGFIAARVADLLVKDGHTVLGVDDLNNAYDVRMKEYRLRCLQEQEGFSFRKLDIADRDAVMDLGGSSFDAVINLAARAGVRQSVEDPWVYVDTNVTGTLNLLEFCRQHDTKKFILASTSSAYGDGNPLPYKEAYDSDRPLQAYAATKKSAEVLCHAYHFLYGLDVTVFRYFTVYGPAGRPDMSMFRFCQWISEARPVIVYGDGEQTRGFTYVDDVARGTILGLKPLGYEIINLGGHESISINELIRLLEGQVGQDAQVEYDRAHPADALENLADVEKAGRLLGWEPQVSLKEGVARMVAWYQQERAWASQIATD